MRERLASILTASLILLTIFTPVASAFEELTLQEATDGLSTGGRATLDHVFWRSGFGASVLGGPTFAGDTLAYNARATELSTLSGGTTPTGALPLFVEFASIPAPLYDSGAGNDSDYATQRWNLTNASRTAGAWSIGAGAAADAAWAAYFLRTNHEANGSQSPTGSLFGASDADGLMALWLVQSLLDRVNATRAGAAYNGSALGAFNFTDPALLDSDFANGWQLVPAGMDVQLSADTVPLFQGFGASDNRSTLAGQAGLILGLGETLRLSDPAGPRAGAFDGSPFDGSLHTNSRELLLATVNNLEAYHWSAAASAYVEPDLGTVDTADLALLVRALAAAESAADPALKANLTAVRARASAFLATLGDAYGQFPATYTVSGPTVMPDTSTRTLAAQASAVQAFAAVFAVTGLKADYDWMFKAGAGLERPLYENGTYHAQVPEPTESTFGARAVSSALGALRALSITGEEPLAIYRFVSTYRWLFSTPPLTLSGPQTPPVTGASFGWNASSRTYAPATDFATGVGLLAAYEFVSTGPEFYAAIGGTVSVTERAALLLHNATAEQVGAVVDGLDAQIANLTGQLAALQAQFDALNTSVSDTISRLNLSLENETISQARIADLQANLSALRLELGNASNGTQLARQQLNEYWQRYNETRDLMLSIQANLTLSQQNETALRGDLNVTRARLEANWTALNTTTAEKDRFIEQSAAAQRTLGAGIAVGGVVGILLGLFVAKFVRSPSAGAPKKDKGRDEEKSPAGKGDEDDSEDEDGDDSEDEK